MDLFWWLLWMFYIVAYIYVVVLIVVDLFRDEKANGWLKALWILFLVFVPFLTALVYIIVNGKAMAQRSAGRGYTPPEADDYRPAASSTPSEDIAKAKELLDAGVISEGEFEAVKSKALGHGYFG